MGTRTPTVYGLKTSKLLIPALIEANVTVVSGLARGIDRSAHEQAIAHQGNTIAVTASGFQTIYPPEHKALFHSIATNHLVLTEYPPFIKPKKMAFSDTKSNYQWNVLCNDYYRSKTKKWVAYNS